MVRKVDVKKYSDDCAAILAKMSMVLMRAQRKVDDKKYRETLEKLKHI